MLSKRWIKIANESRAILLSRGCWGGNLMVEQKITGYPFFFSQSVRPIRDPGRMDDPRAGFVIVHAIERTHNVHTMYKE